MRTTSIIVMVIFRKCHSLKVTWSPLCSFLRICSKFTGEHPWNQSIFIVWLSFTALRILKFIQWLYTFFWKKRSNFDEAQCSFLKICSCKLFLSRSYFQWNIRSWEHRKLHLTLIITVSLIFKCRARSRRFSSC